LHQQSEEETHSQDQSKSEEKPLFEYKRTFWSNGYTCSGEVSTYRKN
jgi:hypothetical protein